MDETVPKLPRYVFRRANGSFRYKRNVPKELRLIFGKDTLYRQLGNTYAEAMKEFPYVHAKIEALFDLERKKTDRERALEIVRTNLGDEAADLMLARSVPEYSPLDYELNELAYKLAGTVPQGVLEQVYKGELQDEPVTLASAFRDYLAYKSDGEGTDRDLISRVGRLQAEMKRIYGRVKFEEVPLPEITRTDATELRDVLLGKMAPNSVLRTLNTVKAAINHTIVEKSLNIPNVFAKLKIKGAGAGRMDRLPISNKHINELIKGSENQYIPHTLLILLADTGARLGEIVGLEVQDVDLEKRTLHIRPNGTRGLKTKSSQRSIPLSQRATEVLKGRLVGLSDTAPIFKQYARLRGRDAASAMLMKRLRVIVQDPKVTIHSLRHRMKDQLRNTGCPENLSKEILGHAQGSIAANYGAGYSIEVMRAALKKAWQ